MIHPSIIQEYIATIVFKFKKTSVSSPSQAILPCLFYHPSDDRRGHPLIFTALLIWPRSFSFPVPFFFLSFLLFHRLGGSADHWARSPAQRPSGLRNPSDSAQERRGGKCAAQSIAETLPPPSTSSVPQGSRSHNLGYCIRSCLVRIFVHRKPRTRDSNSETRAYLASHGFGSKFTYAPFL